MKAICPICGAFRGHLPRNGGFVECMSCNFLFKPKKEREKLPIKKRFPAHFKRSSK